MPPVSQAQRRAMYAAAAGKGNIGIPQKVAREFTAADKPGKLPPRAKTQGKTPSTSIKQLQVAPPSKSPALQMAIMDQIRRK